MNIYSAFFFAHAPPSSSSYRAVLPSAAQWKSSIKSVLTVQVTFPPPPLHVNSTVLHFFFYLTRGIKNWKKIHVHSFCIYVPLVVYIRTYIVWFSAFCDYMLCMCFVVKRTKLRLSQSTCAAVPLLFFILFLSVVFSPKDCMLALKLIAILVIRATFIRSLFIVIDQYIFIALSQRNVTLNRSYSFYYYSLLEIRSCITHRHNLISDTSFLFKPI